MNSTSSAAFALIAAAFALQSCSPQSAPETAAQTMDAAEAPEAGAPQKPAASPAPQPATQPTTAALVGRWGDNGDCTKDIVLNADGTFQSYTGGSGRWSLNGDRMTMAGAAGVFERRVSLANANTLMIGNPDGSFGLSQRC